MEAGLGIGILAFIFAVTSIIIYYVSRLIRIYLLISKFKGPPALPLIGNIHQFSTDSREFFVHMSTVMDEYRQKTGGIVRFWLGLKPSLNIYAAKHMEAILNNSRHMDKGFGYDFVKPWLGLGLLLSSGKKWFHRRKMLTPAFHFSILQNFMAVYNEQSIILAEKLDAFADRSDLVNIFPLVTYSALDVICDTAMGKHINAQGDSDSEYVRAVQGMAETTLMRFKSLLLWYDPIFRLTEVGARQRRYLEILHGTTKSVIQERLNQAVKPRDSRNGDEGAVAGKKKRLAFLDLLIQMHRNDPNFTLQDIQEEVDTFMFAGHDTTATAMCWALLLIGLHPGVQARLHEEIDTVLGDTDRYVTSEDLGNMSYLSLVMKESLRLLPSVPVISRKLDSDIMLDGKLVPKETDITLVISSLHYDPEQFPDPERFDPDRFLPENCAKRHPYAYLPFSAGGRNCIGQKFAMLEARVTLANLLRRFSFQSTQTIEEAKPASEFMIKPAEGKILLRVTRRR
ncbi:cytochrome P450 4C1-like [Diadema antillarum]|uniref:cytochrome P450 4C1-like n=1 Tax=Diadema antillarum TaxID=105358 RepID=UPI003A83BD27